MKVLHIITSLKIVGGAELMLKRLVDYSLMHGNQKPTIMCLTEMGTLGQELRNNGADVRELRIKGAFSFLRAFYQLTNLIKSERPDVVQTWMYHSDLFGGIACYLVGFKQIFWNVRNTKIPQNGLSITSNTIKMCAIMSKIIPKRIICCANSAMETHVDLGYLKKKMVVIPNGYDVRTRVLSKNQVNIVKRKYNIDEKFFIVGLVARFDALKGYDNFVRAARIINQHSSRRTLFVMVGRDVNYDNQVLFHLVKKFGGSAKFKLVGETKNVFEIMSVFDVCCLPSKAEGFPNVVAEAMLTATPCVVTDVGDAKLIVGDCGTVVPPEDPLMLAKAVLNLEKLENKVISQLGKRCRKRIIQKFGIAKAASMYAEQYRL